MAIYFFDFNELIISFIIDIIKMTTNRKSNHGKSHKMINISSS